MRCYYCCCVGGYSFSVLSYIRRQSYPSLAAVVAVVLLPPSTSSPPTQPLVASDHAVHNFFPAKEFAIAIPAALLVLFLVAVGLFVAYTLVKEANKKKSK
jgi:dolichol phosphate-mannose biosynthesis regulatory protein